MSWSRSFIYPGVQQPFDSIPPQNHTIPHPNTSSSAPPIQYPSPSPTPLPIQPPSLPPQRKKAHQASKNLTFLPSPTPPTPPPIPPTPPTPPPPKTSVSASLALSSPSLLLRRSLLRCLASLASLSFQSLTCRLRLSARAWAIAGVCQVTLNQHVPLPPNSITFQLPRALSCSRGFFLCQWR